MLADLLALGGAKIMREILEELKDKDPTFSFLANYDGLLSSRDNNENATRGKSFYNLGKIFYDKSDLDNAEEQFLNALTCTDKSSDHSTILKTLGFLIRIASEKIENDKAQKYIKIAKKVAFEVPQKLDALNAEYFYNLGVVSTYQGQFDEAKKNFLTSYSKAKEENNPELLAKCLLALSNAAYNNRNFKDALQYVTQLEELLKIIDKSYLLGSMYLLAGKIYGDLGEHQRALQSFRQANIILQGKKCWNLLGYILLSKGISYKNLGAFDTALTYFQLALDITESKTFKRLTNLLNAEINDVNDSSVDLYLDKTNRRIREKTLGTIDFKHRFILLEILFLLAKNPGVFYDKEQLAKSIWKDEYNPLIHDKLIYTSVSRLRKLIEPKSEKEEKRKYIIRGKDGYTFNPHTKIRFHMDNKTNFSKPIANVDLSSPV